MAAGLYPNPCEYADIVTSTTHKTLRGPRSGMILAKAQYGAAIDRALFPGIQGGPLVHVIAAKAVCFLEAMTPEFRTYSQQVIDNAQVLAESLQQEGYRVVSGGTDTHLLLVDVFAKGVRGKEAETALDEAYITVNKNAIPFDVNPPLNPSGVRLGSPAVTTRGFREAEMRQVAALIAEALNDVRSQRNSSGGAAARDGAGGPLPALSLEAGSRHGLTIQALPMPLRIALDTRRVADFGIGTYIRNLVRALARVDDRNQYKLITTERPVPEFSDLPPNFETAIFAGCSGQAGSQRKQPGADPLWIVPAKAGGGPFPYPTERRAAADAETLSGDHPRHEHTAVCEPAGLPQPSAALLSAARAATGRSRDGGVHGHLPRRGGGVGHPRQPHARGVQRARSNLSCSQRRGRGA